MSSKVGRRNFLKGFGATVGFLSLGGAQVFAKGSEGHVELDGREFPELAKEGIDPTSIAVDAVELDNQVYEGFAIQVDDEALTDSQYEAVLNTVRQGSPDAFLPEFWAGKSAKMFTNESIYWNRCCRSESGSDDGFLAQQGDVLNVRIPQQMVLRRGADVQMEPVLERVQLPLEDHLYSTMLIKDGEASLNATDLAALYLQPSVIATARLFDMQVHEKALASATEVADIFEAAEYFNTNLISQEGRHGVLSPSSMAAGWRYGYGEDHRRLIDPDGQILQQFGFACAQMGRVSSDVFYQRDGVLTASRPMALPHAGCGVRSCIGAFKGVHFRGTMQYDVSSAGTRVTVDTLTGSAVRPGYVCKVTGESK